MSALKRVWAIAANHARNMGPGRGRGEVIYANDGGELNIKDLIKVLQLAEEAMELKQRVQLAREWIPAALVGVKPVPAFLKVAAALDLSKPLPPKRGRR